MSLPNVEIPEVLKKPIEEIKNPILRGWIITLVLAVIMLGSLLIYQNQNKDKNYKAENTDLKNQLNDCSIENRDLRGQIRAIDAAEIRRLQDRNHFFDSVLTSIKSIKNEATK